MFAPFNLLLKGVIVASHWFDRFVLVWRFMVDQRPAGLTSQGISNQDRLGPLVFRFIWKTPDSVLARSLLKIFLHSFLCLALYGR